MNTYDDELEALHDTVQLKVVTLLSDNDNIVKQTLLENGITRLGVFFGRQKGKCILSLILSLHEARSVKMALKNELDIDLNSPHFHCHFF